MRKRDRIAYLFLAYSLAVFLLFTVTPFCMVAYLSLFKTNYLYSKFIGLKNYIKIFDDPMFWKTIINSLLYAAFLIPLGVGVPLVISLAAFDMNEKAKNYVRFMFYVPSLTSGIIMSGIWSNIFRYRNGLANYFMQLAGFERVHWFGHRFTAIAAISLMVSTIWIGGSVLLFMAVMKTITSEMIEAARIEGASSLQVKMRVVIPVIAPWLLFWALLKLIASFQIFEFIWKLTGGGPGYGTATMMYDIYSTGFIDSKYGIASAKSLVMMIVLIGVAVVHRIAQGKEEKFV